MQRRTQWTLIGLILVAVVGVVRMHRLSRTGSEEFAMSLHRLRSATIGKVADCRTPAQLFPDRQLDYWNRAIDEVLAQHPHDAGLHAAAATVLSQPCLLFASDVATEIAGSGQFNVWNYGGDVMARMKDSRGAFDVNAAGRGTELIRRAIELDPDNRIWWRVRARLLWPPMMSNDEDTPREKDWQEVLAKARDVDAGNSLYNIIEARHMAEQAIDFDEELEFVVTDAANWQRAIKLAGQITAAQELILGEPAINGLVRLHQLAGHPVATTTESLRSRFVSQELVMDVCQLIRGLLRMSEVKSSPSGSLSPTELVALATQIADVAVARSGAEIRYDTNVAKLRVWAWRERERLEKEAGEVSEFTKRGLTDAIVWENDLTAASVAFASAIQVQSNPAAEAVSAISIALIGPWMLMVVITLVLWFAMGRQASHLALSLPLGLMFLIAIGVSFVFLGVVPARQISGAIQDWMLTALVFAWGIGMVAGMAMRSRLRLRFSIRSLLIASAVVAVAFQLAFQWQIGWESLGLPIKASATADQFVAIIESQVAPDSETWLFGSKWISRANAEWLAHHGPVASIAIFGIGWITWMIWRRDWMREIGHLSATSLAFAVAPLCVWIWVEPAIVASVRPKTASYERYIESVDAYYSPLERAMSLADDVAR
ncbi:hypothetical protein [Rubripirellula reticaptiva]|uniref:Uncharacterized protein n=1 Tax=Rubripirellula reticaptiva TaxID=2528013 RepID=A0A5C6FCV9_9BACT|nr:hypothetical protein [Rubripirellula reticaptiva]TWU57479.1 hypothetical protein Poly59_03860 [Rubripirellula reticaptiva]